MIMGDSGIFTKAQETKKTEIADIKEQIKMGILNEQVENQGSILDTRLEEIFNGTTEEG